MPENQELLNEQQEQQQTDAGNAIYILGRNTYDSWEDYGNNIFFVRENSDTLSDMVSLYVGQAKQSDVVVATSESDIWDPVTNTYNIPEKYQVSGKLFFIERDIPTYDQNSQDVKMYGTVIWDGEKFVDCGNPNNVIVLTNVDDDISNLRQWLSQNITGIKDFIYIIPNYHSIYYYDGANGYTSIISVDNFVTVEMLNEVAARVPIADELTILSRVNNGQTEFYGAGADLSGKKVIVGSSGSYTSVTAGTGAHIFNNYDPQTVSGLDGLKYGTTATGYYASAFGSGNLASGSNSAVFGTGNTTTSSGASSVALGSSNSISSQFSVTIGNSNITNNTAPPSGKTYGYAKIAIGSFNSVDGYSYSTDVRNFSGIAIGYKNTITSTSTNSIAIGGYCGDYGSGGSYIEVCNTIDTPNSIVIGSGNTLLASHSDSNNNYVIGKSNTVYKMSDKASGAHIFGDSNTLSDQYAAGNIRGTTYVVGENNVIGPNGVHGDGSFIFGWNNQIGFSGQSYSGHTILLGHDLHSPKFGHLSDLGTLFIGRFNDGTGFGTSNESYYDADIVIANGTSSVDRFNAVEINGKNIVVDPHRKTTNNGSFVSFVDFQGDVMSGHGTSLTLRSGDLSPMLSVVGAWQENYLPVNNSITKVEWNNATSLEFVLDLTYNKFTFPVYANSSVERITIEETPDYSCLLVIPKLASFTTASDILVNFTANDATKIYLLNPDIDITDYTVLHVLLFYDLTNLCAIVSGYEEVTVP